MTSAFLGCALAFGCQDLTPEVRVEQVKSPMTISGEPNLCCTGENIPAMSWIEENHGRSALKWAIWDDHDWGESRVIAEGEDWFVNWADFPMMCHGEAGLVTTNYLKKSGEGTYSYDVVLRLSLDGGKTWGDELIPHQDGTESEHGFVSLVPYEDHLIAIWLDGRNYASGNEQMTLRAAEINRDGTIHKEFLIDDRVCDCCPTSAIETATGIMVAYRDRSENEIRDIGTAHFDGTNWSIPEILFDDNWEIAGCPVNGPAIDANGQTVAVAWYTGANDRHRVKMRLSSDGGLTFGDVIVVKDSGTIGRVDVAVIPGGGAVVSWLDESLEETAIKYRQIAIDGTIHQAHTVATSSSERASGFPKMILAGDSLLFAWTETGDVRGVVSKWEHITAMD